MKNALLSLLALLASGPSLKAAPLSHPTTQPAPSAAPIAPASPAEAETATERGEAQPLNRGLLAVKVGGGVLVSWRMRQYDDRSQVQYVLYRAGDSIATLSSRTNYLDAGGSAGTRYTIEVRDGQGNVTETQTTSAWNDRYRAIPLAKAPTDTNGTGATYTPNDATVYDMDGDGEQEIVFRWEPSNVKDGANTGKTGAVYLECIKLNGTQLWRINLGPNCWASQHTYTFLCYDFDGDGYGELIVRCAPGTIDGQGNPVVMEGDDPTRKYVASNGRVSSGPEYLTVFDGTTGAAISSIHYWPAHDDFPDNNAAYGSQARIERYNATLARLDVGGRPTPCAVMNHGYYSQAYYQAAWFDGKELHELWRHASTTKGQGMYGEGYHTLQSADLDGDGFDEIVVGSAVLDHTGKTLWRSGDGHGDALHIGDFNWEHDGLEIYSVKEETSSAYDDTMREGATGRLIFGHKQTGGDTGRGLCADFDSTHDGAESMNSSSASLYDQRGAAIADWHVGTTSSSGINYRIYWDGDLCDEYHDRQHIDKWDAGSHSWGRLTTLYNIGPGASAINGTKYVPNLQADILGDWREEVIYWYTIDAAAGLFGLNLIVTDMTSDYMLPYLRDDPLYDNAIAWQNATYNQPPHLSYSPIEYFTVAKEADTADDWLFVPFCCSYPTTRPEGVELYYVFTLSKTWVEGQDTAALRVYDSAVIPAGVPFLARVPATGRYKFRPTNSAPTGGVILANQLSGGDFATTYANGLPASKSASSPQRYFYYTFRHDPALGYGFFLIPDEGYTSPDNSCVLRVSVNTTTRTPQPYYLLGAPFNDANSSAIGTIRPDDPQAGRTYDLTGRPAGSQTRGLCVSGGQKLWH